MSIPLVITCPLISFLRYSPMQHFNQTVGVELIMGE
jgi:hypothetical protein